MKGVKRKINVEKVGAGSWKPSLCETSRNYKRGYLFYRLMLQAKNSKIIGLSGTPLINFPEELGILSNILHGYIPIIEGVIAVSGMEERIRALLYEYQYIDFVRVEADRAGGGIRIMCSLLPEGIVKISNDIGVRRIAPGEPTHSREEIIVHLKDMLVAKGYKFSQQLTLSALPLLPPFGEEFGSLFVDRTKGLIKNNVVLLKRLSGLISYYKGARQDRMPTVKKDIVVRVSMSEYQQKLYILGRSEEINKDKNKKTSGGLDAIWSEVYEIAGMKNSTSYRMSSRQVCNFAFPPQVKRPRANNIEDENLEAPDTKDIIDTIPEGDEEFPELPQSEEGEDAELVEHEENAIDAEEVEPTDTEHIQVSEELVAPVEKTKLKSVKDIVAAKKAKQISDCKAGQRVGETYRTAIERAKKCLVDLTSDSLRLDNTEGLRVYSPKFATILLNIQNAPGSSLVYSQFLDMEGIGIFRLVMDANGYAPIEIEATATGFQFSKATEESLRKGSLQPRYITFSGAEKEEIRRLALDVFNANFNELPANIKMVLLESGFENNNNRQGQICRVFCITSAGAEGLSLKNVRAVHIMEPYWNDVRLKQVKGRAIRIGSHLDLPEKDRNVSCYTYITVFGQEAQIARVGELRIDETVRNKDSLERKEAIEAHVPIPEGASTYVLTSDERLFVISERKKQIINELETIMKISAVDCSLNYEENKDGTYRCLNLDGKVGDFLYHPDLLTDIRESSSMYQVEERNLLKIRVKDKIYRVEKKGEIYIVYAEDATDKPIGSMPSKDNKPSLPITFY